MFDNLVIASESSVTVALEKDYVDSLGLNDTLADSLKGYAGKAYQVTVGTAASADSAQTTALKVTSLGTEWGQSTASTTLTKLDFSSYSMFKSYVDAVAANVTSEDSAQGNVYINFSSASGSALWSVTGVSSEVEHAIDYSDEATARDWLNLSTLKSTVSGWVGKKVYFVVDATVNGTTSSTPIVSASLTKPTTAGTKYVELDLTNDNAIENWKTIVANILSKKAVAEANLADSMTVTTVTAE